MADEGLRIGGPVAVMHVPGQCLQLAQRAERAGRRGAAATAVQARAQIGAHRPRRHQALQRGIGKAAASMHNTHHIIHSMHERALQKPAPGTT